MKDPLPIEAWPDRCEAAVRRAFGPRGEFVLLRETASTQDAAREYARVGTVVAAWRQTHGRGRLGRRWSDPHGDGVAVSMVVEAAQPATLSLAAALASCAAIEGAIESSRGDVPALGIKWPNDIVLSGRKLGGILVERTGPAATVGIGINVRQRAFLGPLANRAVSLAQAGYLVDRLEVLERLILELPVALALGAAELAQRAEGRDILRGKVVRFSTPQGAVEGRVAAIDPLRGLRVFTSAGERLLAPETTSVLMDEERLEWHERPC